MKLPRRPIYSWVPIVQEFLEPELIPVNSRLFDAIYSSNKKSQTECLDFFMTNFSDAVAVDGLRVLPILTHPNSQDAGDALVDLGNYLDMYPREFEGLVYV